MKSIIFFFISAFFAFSCVSLPYQGEQQNPAEISHNGSGEDSLVMPQEQETGQTIVNEPEKESAGEPEDPQLAAEFPDLEAEFLAPVTVLELPVLFGLTEGIEEEQLAYAGENDETPESSLYMERLLTDLEHLLAEREQQLTGMEERLRAMEQLLADMERMIENMQPVPAAQAPPVLQTPPASQTPLPQEIAAQTPVAAEPPPVEEFPPGEEIAQEIEEEVPFFWMPEIPQAPAARVDSLTQMGMTPLDREIIFSRIVYAQTGQILEIPFRGNGWVFMGEQTSRRGITYNSRQGDAEGLSFIFFLEDEGVFTLRFYRQDFLRDYILNDHVQVIVSKASDNGAGFFGERVRITAQPRWPSAVEEAQIRGGSRQTAEPAVSGAPPAQAAAPVNQAAAPVTQAAAPVTQTAAAQTPAATVSSPEEETQNITAISPPQAAPDVMLQRAQEMFETGDAASAIALLDEYSRYYPIANDEVLWMYGQFYEAGTPSRNILRSIQNYRQLVNEYPQSARLNEARRRISYLERFYINIQ